MIRAIKKMQAIRAPFTGLARFVWRIGSGATAAQIYEVGWTLIIIFIEKPVSIWRSPDRVKTGGRRIKLNLCSHASIHEIAPDFVGRRWR